jgi:hypothetical protein
MIVLLIITICACECDCFVDYDLYNYPDCGNEWLRLWLRLRLCFNYFRVFDFEFHEHV